MAAKAARPDPLAEFRDLAKPRRLKCSFVRILDALSPEDGAALNAALDADWVRHTDISRWLASRGFKVDCRTVGRHRIGECSCDV